MQAASISDSQVLDALAVVGDELGFEALDDFEAIARCPACNRAGGLTIERDEHGELAELRCDRCPDPDIRKALVDRAAAIRVMAEALPAPRAQPKTNGVAAFDTEPEGTGPVGPEPPLHPGNGGEPDLEAVDPEGAVATRLEFLDPISLEGVAIPERRWIVANWVPRGVVTGLYGDGGTGKSLLAQQMMTATAIGKPWLGLSTASVRAIGVFCEDDAEELHRRQADLNRLYGCEFSDLENARWFPRLGADNLMMTFDGGVGSLAPFFEQLLSASKDFGAELVILDTAADIFGGNENARTEVRQFVGALGRLAREISGGVVVCAHPSRAGLASGEGDSGSTGWSNAFRSRLYLHRPAAEGDEAPDDNARILSRRKANYAGRADQVKLRWCDGAFVTEGAPTGILGTIQRRHADDVFLELLDAVRGEGRHVTESHNAANYAPRLFSRRPERDGYTKADFARAMERLFAANRITTAIYGRRGDARREIVRIEAAAERPESDGLL